jgi:hypothetical protein
MAFTGERPVMDVPRVLTIISIAAGLLADVRFHDHLGSYRLHITADGFYTGFGRFKPGYVVLRIEPADGLRCYEQSLSVHSYGFYVL